MWIWLSVLSAVLLGLYDVAKKKALSSNGVMTVLLVATALSTLFLSPFLFMYEGSAKAHLILLFKAFLVTVSWISGMIALKLLPLTTASTLKASRPFFVVLFSILIFGERLNLWQWGGVALAFVSMTLLGISSNKKEGIDFRHNAGVLAMAVCILSGVSSALFDKKVIMNLAPLFVQSWSNFYITVLLAICLFVQKQVFHKEEQPFKWDWTLLAIAVLITCADAAYFFALKQEGALLSVISIVRRCSVIVTFGVGAALFKERNVGSKAFYLAILLAGMVLLVIGS